MMGNLSGLELGVLHKRLLERLGTSGMYQLRMHVNRSVTFVGRIAREDVSVLKPKSKTEHQSMHFN